MKKLLFPLLFLAPVLQAADLSTSQTFADGDTANAAKLNNLIGQATILPGSISDRTSATPLTTDWINFLQVSSNSIKKAQFSALPFALSASPTFTGTTTVSEAFAVTGIISPSQITSNQNDYAPTGFSTASTLRLSTDASRNITGLAGGSSGRTIFIHNVGSFNIVLVDESASSTVANRFALVHDVTIPPDGMVLLHYGGTSNRWRCSAAHYHTRADLTDLSTGSAFTTLTDGATITLTCDTTKYEQNAKVTIGATGRTFAISGVFAGAHGVLEVIQDATGSRTITTWPSPWKVVNGGSGAITLSTAANSIDVISWYYDGTNYLVTYGKNFN